MASHNEKEFSVKKPKVRRVANKQISFRVNEAEYEKLQQSAKNLNMSVPAFVKKKAQGAKLVRPVVEQEIALEIS
ncbi:plasmid mobilization protein, partial [Enterococcus faecium]